jgi:hypothetical protein
LCKHVIELKDGCELGRSPGMRVKSEADQRFIKATTDKLLAFGLIKRVQGAAHASQVHIAKVPGRDPRFCLDYRQEYHLLYRSKIAVTIAMGNDRAFGRRLRRRRNPNHPR